MVCTNFIQILFISVFLYTGRSVESWNTAATPSLSPLNPVPRTPAPNLKGQPTHLLTALDCRHPTHQRTTLLDKACAPPQTRPKVKLDSKNFALLQRSHTFSRPATRCKKFISTLTEICGRWGHSKLLFPPRILEPTPISEEECKLLSEAKLYKDERGHTHVVSTADFRYEVVLHGGLAYSKNDVRCSGANRVEIEGRVFDDVLVLATYLLEIRQVTVTDNRGHTEDEESGLLLPPNCATQLACSGGDPVYVFSTPSSTCPLAKIKYEMFDMYQISKQGLTAVWAQNDRHHLVFELGAPLPATSSCEDVLRFYRPTQFRELVLVEEQHLLDPAGLLPLEGPQVDLQLEERVVDSYERMLLEEELRNLTTEVAGELCTLARDSWTSSMLSPYHQHALLRVRGEVLQELSCTPVEVTVTEGDTLDNKCFRDSLPVVRGGEHLLLEANSRLLQDPSPMLEIPCTELGAPVFAVGTEFLVADPVVRSLNIEIDELTLFQSGQGHSIQRLSKFSDPLLYTRGELQAFKDLVAHKAARKAVTHGFAREYCGRTGSCGSYAPPSGILQFDQLLQSVNPTSWFSTLRGYVQEAGEFCSIIVVLSLIFKLFSTVANFFNFKVVHGYGTRDAWNLTFRPGDLVTRYAAKIQADDRPNSQGKPQD